MKSPVATSLTFFAAIGAMLWMLILLSSAHSNVFANYYTTVLLLTGALAIFMLSLVGVQLFSLLKDYKKRVFGARLKLRLMLIFGAIAVLPGVLVYGASMQFINRSMENWFDARIERALDSGVQLGRNALDSLLDEQSEKTRVMTEDLSTLTPQAQRLKLLRMIETHSVASAGIFSANGQLIASAEAVNTLLQSTLSLPPQISDLRAAKTRTVRNIETIGDSLLLRVLMPIPNSSVLNSENTILQTLQTVPIALQDNIDDVQEVFRDYRELQTSKIGLNRVYMMTLTLTVLVALFSAFTMAYYMARRLTAPLHILAEGTKAVAQGDFSPRKTIKSGDEFGILTQSFKQMTSQLDDARLEAERRRQQVENARAYLESILANLSTGVLVFDAQFILRTCNSGAQTILNDSFQQLLNTHPQHWQRQNVLGNAIIKKFQQSQEMWQEQIELAHPQAKKQVLLLRGSLLPENLGAVVVFDDVTRLIESERDAAWGEVARRLAHEIKNPLTPIQLSAERLQLKLAQSLDGKNAEILQRSTQTIINQVQAMKQMVNDFRDYARLPTPTIVPLDLNALIHEVLGLYESSKAAIVLNLEKNLPAVLGDSTQLRQVIHNIWSNAEDALENKANPQITIETKGCGTSAHLSVLDNGDGFPMELLGRIFEPYVTTKARGTGLGLSIVKKIIEEHHGFVEIGNRLDGGAKIHIRLPLSEKAERH